MSEYIYRSHGEPLVNEHGEIHLALAGGIVRCRDCKHYEPYRTHKHGIMNRCIDENGHSHRREPDGFCSWAVRRDA